MRSVKEVHARVLTRTLSGGIKGAAVGAAASLATGAAVVVTAPAWLPFVGGTALIAAGTVALWSGIGSGLGAIVSGSRAYLKHKQEEAAFREAFPPVLEEPIPEEGSEQAKERSRGKRSF